MSYRKTIAEAFKAALLGKTSAGQNVFLKLDRPLGAAEMPALIVYANKAERENEDYGNTIIRRHVAVTVDGLVQSTPDAALDMGDALADSVEAIFESNSTLGGAVEDVQWQRTMTGVDSVGQQTLGVCLLHYSVTILTPIRREQEAGDFDFMPDTVFSVPDVSGIDLFPRVQPSADVACGEDGCAPPAWGGDVKPNGEPSL